MFRRLLVPIIVLVGVGACLICGFWMVKERSLNINQWFVGGMDFGVDVSSYQTDVDFEKLAEQGVKFAYIKATEGDSHKDPSFKEKWAAVEGTEVLSGAYHYFSYGVSGVKQAENYIETVGDLGGRLIPAVDMELTTEEVYNPPEKEAVVRGLKAFMALIEEKYQVKPMIYSRQDYYEKYLADDFASYPRWVTNVYLPIWIESGDGWVVWQYNDKGILEGYGGEKYIDFNAVNSSFGLDSLKMK